MQLPVPNQKHLMCASVHSFNVFVSINYNKIHIVCNFISSCVLFIMIQCVSMCL